MTPADKNPEGPDRSEYCNAVKGQAQLQRKEEYCLLDTCWVPVVFVQIAVFWGDGGGGEGEIRGYGSTSLRMRMKTKARYFLHLLNNDRSCTC